MDFIEQHLQETRHILARLDRTRLDAMVNALAVVRERGGRLYFLGVGGGAAHASHAVNDFRKLCGFEAQSPTDNVSELTARINDEGWEHCFADWLRASGLGKTDAVFVFSVGGGDQAAHVSPNLVRALEYAKQVGATILGVVGRDGGFTAKVADACVIVPTVNANAVTPHTEAFQAVVWHLLISHPTLKRSGTKWETLVKTEGER